MDRVKRDGIFLVFFCEGCEDTHIVNVETSERLNNPWGWNKRLDLPTVTPSVRVRKGTMLCHSFVRDGRIQYLPDCTHDYRGKEVNLLPVDQWREPEWAKK